MSQADQEPREERIRTILVEVEECIASGKRPQLERYFLRYPELEEELRVHFRRLGLLDDPFRDAGHYRGDRPPWDLPDPGEGGSKATPSGATPPGPRSKPGWFLMENLYRPVVHGDGRIPLKKRYRTMIAMALAFVVGWVLLVILEGLSGPAPLETSARGRLEGLASLLALSVEWPQARQDFLSEGAIEADRSIRAEQDRWEFRWLRFLFLQGLGRADEAARDLEALPTSIGRQLFWEHLAGREGGGFSGDLIVLKALGEILEGRTARAKEILQGQETQEDTLLAAIARGSLESSGRQEVARRLLHSGNSHARLLGAVWGVAAGDPSARKALREIDLSGIAAARVLVELGEDDVFLERAWPDLIDLAPLRIRILRRRGKTAEALKYAERMLLKYQSSFELRMALAQLLGEEGDAEGASRHLRMAMLLCPSSEKPMREWMRLAREFGEEPGLIQPCAELFLQRVSTKVRELLERDRGRRGISSWRIREPERFLVSAGFGFPREDPARAAALKALSSVASSKPKDVSLQFLLARSLFACGQWKRAAEIFEVAEGVADDHLNRQAIRFWRAASLRRAGQAEEALGLEKALAADGPDPLAGGSEKPPKALEIQRRTETDNSLQRSLSTDPELEKELVQIAQRATGRGPPEGDPRKTLELLNGRIELKSSSPGLLFEYARALEWTGSWSRAALVFSELVSRNPESPAYRARGAWAFAFAGEWDRAEGLLFRDGQGKSSISLTSAAKKKNWMPGIEQLLVGAFLAAGKDDSKLLEEYLNEAVSLVPTDFRGWFLRGYFRRLQGMGKEADRDWNEVVRISEADIPDQPERKKSTGDAFELDALPWALALIYAFRGDLETAGCFASQGPPSGHTLPGVFFHAAAQCAASNWVEAEREAFAYRARGFPLFSWQAQDPWVGKLFSP